MIPYNPLSLPRGITDEAVTQENVAPTFSKPYYRVLYFGYASNLSFETMKQRCPDSLFTGLARLQDWKWVINSTGYANIVPSHGDVVYGSLSFLSNRDEDALDQSEGVPWMYQKHNLMVNRLDGDGKDMDTAQVEAMTYVDGTNVETDGKIEPDYIVWVNKAIRDGIACGMPAEYAEKYLRPFTPKPSEDQDIVMIRTTKRLDQQLRAPQAPER